MNHEKNYVYIKHASLLFYSISKFLAIISGIKFDMNHNKMLKINTALKYEIEQIELRLQFLLESELKKIKHILCAYADEIFMKYHHNLYLEWDKISLLKCFHNDNCSGKNIFNMIDSKSKGSDTTALTLLFFILALGYKGQYYNFSTDSEIIKRRIYNNLSSDLLIIKNKLEDNVKRSYRLITIIVFQSIFIITNTIFILKIHHVFSAF